MKSTIINQGTVMVDGRERTLSHVCIQVGDPQSRCGATQYHEIAYFVDKPHGVHVEVFETGMDSESANTLFYLLNSRKVSIDTRIRLAFSQSRV